MFWPGTDVDFSLVYPLQIEISFYQVMKPIHMIKN